jgi:DNA (cytosine-5)-methyltransferase 1
MRTVELFAGIGGFRIAADRCGFETVWANDTNQKACAVYRNRFGPDSILEGDIHSLAHTIPAHDLLTAGFPCQPFSSAGKKNGTRDPRGTLFQVIVDVLRVHRPTWFVLENVKRLLTMERGAHFDTILSSLTALGYKVEWRLLNATSFGLPQNRQRVILVGSRDARCGVFVDPPQATTCPRLADVLETYVPGEFDFTEATLRWLPNNEPVNRFVDGVEILSNQEGGRRMGYTIFGINGVAPTLTATTSRHYERYKVGDRYRRLTNVEYARLQGFPDDHCSAASVYDQYALFGNAVPPPLIEWVFQRILDRTVTYRASQPSAISSNRRRDGDQEGQVLAGVRARARKKTERTR